MTRLTPDAIKRAIDAFECDHHKRTEILYSSHKLRGLRPAAVMIPLIVNNGDWHMVLTQRSEILEEHRGQVAFPGGAQEASDKNLQWTALREMQEEIGVKPEDVEVFGHLCDIPIITNYMVRIFVGQIPWPYPLLISEDEVDSVFTLPLLWLADPKHHTIRFRRFAGREFPVIYFELYDGYLLWGASAEMTLTLLSALNPVL